VKILENTLAEQAYQSNKVMEEFRCHYGLNPKFHNEIFTGAMKVSGIGKDGEARIIELSDHPFFVATLFVPQLCSSYSMPHPLIVAYLKAAVNCRY
jgi:CTP synthase (UTP-ammonia lyase)